MPWPLFRACEPAPHNLLLRDGMMTVHFCSLPVLPAATKLIAHVENILIRGIAGFHQLDASIPNSSRLP